MADDAEEQDRNGDGKGQDTATRDVRCHTYGSQSESHY